MHAKRQAGYTKNFRIGVIYDERFEFSKVVGRLFRVLFLM